MPATLQPVIMTPSLPLLLAFYRALFGAAEISRVPEDGPALYGQPHRAYLGEQSRSGWSQSYPAPHPSRDRDPMSPSSTGPYRMNAAPVLSEQHERGIHAV